MKTAIDINKVYTYADYLTWLDDKRRELIDGIVKLMSPAALDIHSVVTVNLVSRLKSHVRKSHCGCKIRTAPYDVRLPRNGEKDDKDLYTVVQPDVCVICDASKIDRRGCLGAPDLIVEIASPSTMRYDLTEKFALYERSGVREYWLVYPAEPAVTVFLLQPDGKYDEGTVYEEGTESVPVHILEGLNINWEEIFED